MGVGLGNSIGPFRGPMSLGVPKNPTDFECGLFILWGCFWVLESYVMM